MFELSQILRKMRRGDSSYSLNTSHLKLAWLPLRSTTGMLIWFEPYVVVQVEKEGRPYLRVVMTLTEHSLWLKEEAALWMIDYKDVFPKSIPRKRRNKNLSLLKKDVDD